MNFEVHWLNEKLDDLVNVDQMLIDRRKKS